MRDFVFNTSESFYHIDSMLNTINGNLQQTLYYHNDNKFIKTIGVNHFDNTYFHLSSP